MRPCAEKHPEPIYQAGEAWDATAAGACRYCWLYVNDERYRNHWDQPAPAKIAKSPPRATCERRGPERRLEGCKTCKGERQIKVFECEIHGECSTAKDVGVAVCAKCHDYQGVTE